MLANWNEEPKPFTWSATADVILAKVGGPKELKLYATIFR
jgi:hypothetical protein